MKKFDIQMYAEAVAGSKLVYLYRIMSKAATADEYMNFSLIILTHYSIQHIINKISNVR